MTNNFYQAKYMLSLATNTLTDEIRANFLNSVQLNNAQDAWLIFYKTLSAIKKNKNISLEEEKELMQQEFDILGVEKYIGEYNTFKNLFDALVDIDKVKYAYSEWLSVFKTVYDASETLPADFKVCVYNVILNNLVRYNLVADDIDFTTAIMDFISNNNIELSDYTNFSAIIELTANNL